MRLKRAWELELQIALAFGAGAVLLGFVMGSTKLWLVLALVLYTLRLLIHLGRIARWINGRETHYPPDAIGIVGVIGQGAFNQLKVHDAEHERLRTIVDEFTRSAQALPDSIVILDEAHNIRWCNAVAARLLGVNPEQDAGQPLENLVRHPAFVRYLRDGAFSEAIDIPAPTNPDLALSVRVLPYGVGQHVLVARDVTESQRVEKMRRDFISNVSHELRTPITVLKGYLERLQGKTPPTGERLAHTYSVMDAQVTRLTTVVEDLLLLSRVESVDAAPTQQLVDIHQVMLEIREEATALSDDHTIVSECDRELKVWGDYQELRTAFSNLLRNAVQYSRPDSEIRMTWEATEDGAAFSVVDSGEGIEPAHIPRLTERFYRVDAGRSRDTGGTGLGLAIVKHILNHYGGHLEITSEINVGSTFRCHIPADLINVDRNVVSIAASARA